MLFCCLGVLLHWASSLVVANMCPWCASFFTTKKDAESHVMGAVVSGVCHVDRKVYLNKPMERWVSGVGRVGSRRVICGNCSGTCGSMLICSRFGSSWKRRVRQTIRTMREIREEIQATPVQANKKNRKTKEQKRSETSIETTADADLELDNGERNERVARASHPYIPLSLGNRGYEVHPQDGESVSGQGGVRQVTPERKCGSTSRSTISTWTAEHVDHARSARIDVGDTSNELVRQLEVKLVAMK